MPVLFVGIILGGILFPTLNELHEAKKISGPQKLLGKTIALGVALGCIWFGLVVQ